MADITGRQLNYIDIGVGDLVLGAPPDYFQGVLVFECEPEMESLAGMREFEDGSVDSPASQAIFSWHVVMDLTQYPDTTAGVKELEKLLWFCANRPQFMRCNSAEWVKRYGATTWVPVVVVGKLPMKREANLYKVEFTARAAVAVSISKPVS